MVFDQVQFTSFLFDNQKEELKYENEDKLLAMAKEIISQKNNNYKNKSL